MPTAARKAVARAPFPRRTVHLDFHTGPDVPGLAADFDAAEFAATFVAAHVDSVTVFAKCHHGHLYYDTSRPERHPHLRKELDLLAEQVEALHRVGIRAPVYVSAAVDEYAANNHPDWLALDSELRQVKKASGRYAAGWQILDMASPYQDYLAEQIEEVLDHFGTVDGLFIDMCWDQESSSAWAIDAMQRAGLDPRRHADRLRHARQVAHGYMQRYRDMVLPHLAANAPQSIWFNSRPKTALAEESRFVDHVEIEALPTGGWGYSYFPYIARFVRPLGVPSLAHTGRFHKSWGDNGGLKEAAALKYECCQMLAHGVTGGVGDVLHPRGRLEPAVYSLIGDAYGYLERCEPFVKDAAPLADIAVLISPDLGDTPGPVGVGVVRGLQQLRQQFDILAPSDDIAAYRLVIVPETTRVDDLLAHRLRDYVAAGGAVLFSGQAGVDDDGTAVLPAEQGVTSLGVAPYANPFLHDLAAGIDQFRHVVYEPVLQFEPQAGSTSLYALVRPYFERSWDAFCGHDYTPHDTQTSLSVVVQRGRVITCGVPIFTAFGRHGAGAHRLLLSRCVDALLPDPLVRIGGPVHLEATVVATTTTRVVHLLSFLASRESEGVSVISGELEGIDLVHDAFPLLAVEVSVRSSWAPASVRLQPHGVELPWVYSDGYVHVTVDIPDGHGMVVLSAGWPPNGADHD